MEQRIGRIYRLGQRRPIDVYNLVTQGGIEARIANLVAHKKAAFSGLFDGTSNEVRFDDTGSFLESLAKVAGTLDPAASQDQDPSRIANAPVEPGTLGDAESDDAEDELNELTSSRDGSASAELDDVTRANASNTALDSFDAATASPATLSHLEALGPLLSGVQVVRSADGGVQLTASPLVAEPLAAFFESLARSLRQR